MAPGSSTVAACGCAVLLAGCAPQLTTTAAHLSVPPPQIAFALNADPLDTPSKAKEVAMAVAPKPESALVSLDSPSASAARCPADMALVEDRVCVDKWEATLVERFDGGERAWSPFLAIDGHENRMRAVSRAGVVPQAYISGDQAARACLPGFGEVIRQNAEQ